MAVSTAVALGGAALLGAFGGSQGSKSTSKKQLGSASESEREGGRVATNQLQQLEQLINEYGPGGDDVKANQQAQQDLIARLNKMAQSGGLPNAQQQQQGRDMAAQQLAPERIAMKQLIERQQVESARRAGQLGRAGNDPILQAKMAQFSAQAEERFGARQSALGSQFANAMPDRQLGFQVQAAQIQSGLASQALSNRSALLGLGSNLQSGGQGFRASTATTTNSSGGGFAGAVTGALGGLGAGANVMSAFNNFNKTDNNVSGGSLSSGGSGLGSTMQPF